MRLRPNFYGGIRFDRRDSRILNTEEDGLLEQVNLIPGNTGGVSQGIGLVGRFDTRDNLISTLEGAFSEMTLTRYSSIFSGDFKFTKWTVDSRIFFDVNGKDVFAGQLFIEQNWGTPSFENMALMGGPFLMRGNFEGRFRDRAMWVVQGEYRLPLGRPAYIYQEEKVKFWDRFGAVGFLGLGSVLNNLDEDVFNDVKVTGGVGLRFLLFPEERINIRVDAGFGTQTPAFYIFVRESF